MKKFINYKIILYKLTVEAEAAAQGFWILSSQCDTTRVGHCHSVNEWRLIQTALTGLQLDT